MSVLIKGMKMPQNCDACPMLYEYRFCALTDDHASSIEWKMEEKRMPNCPLIELPDHGDLIDRDKVVEGLAGWILKLANTYGKNDAYVRCLEEVCEILGQHREVIPAERGKE